MNRKIASILATGAVVLGLGAFGVSNAVASTNAHPSKTTTPPAAKTKTGSVVTGKSGASKTSSLSKQAGTKKAAASKSLKSKASTKKAAVPKPAPKKGGIQMKARAKTANAKAQLRSTKGNAQAKAGTRVKGG